MLTKEQKAAWIKALRTKELPDGTKIEQGTTRLRLDNKLCCLGVLCELIPNQKEYPRQTEVHELGLLYKYGNSIGGLPVVLATLADMDGLAHFADSHFAFKKHELVTKYERFSGLSSANDSGATFDQIADFLEANLNTAD